MDSQDTTVKEESREAGGRQKKIEELSTQIELLTNNWKRAAADYQNLQKRIEKEKEEWFKFSNLVLLERLLGLLDDLERAQAHLKDSGLDMVLKKLKNIFLDQGLKEIEVTVGGEFDPNFQECVEVVAGENQRVVQVLSKGYIMGERLVRPAKVKVSKIETQDSSLKTQDYDSNL